MSEHNSGESILAFLLGAAIGAALGILFAPAAGKDTRKKLLEAVEDLQDKAEDMAIQTKEKVKEKVAEAENFISEEKERLAAAVAAGKKAYETKK
jgi:gas vesicle protein